MAARAPTSSFSEEVTATSTGLNVNKTADHDGSIGRLLLIVAAQAKGLIACNQHPGIDAAVRVVACRATFA